MSRALLLLAALAAVTAAAFQLANTGGRVEIEVGDTWIGATFPVAVTLLAVGFLALHGLLRFLGWLGGRRRGAGPRGSRAAAPRATWR